MKKILFCVFAILSAIIMLSACVTTNSVSNGRVFQKRKYTEGYHFARVAKPESPSDLTESSEIPIQELDVQIIMKSTCENSLLAPVVHPTEEMQKIVISGGNDFFLLETDKKENVYKSKKLKQFESVKGLLAETPAQNPDQLAVKALRFGIYSSIPYAGIVFSVMALVYGIRALIRKDEFENPSKSITYSIIGIVSGSITLVLMALVIGFYLFLIFGMGYY